MDTSNSGGTGISPTRMDFLLECIALQMVQQEHNVIALCYKLKRKVTAVDFGDLSKNKVLVDLEHLHSLTLTWRVVKTDILYYTKYGSY